MIYASVSALRTRGMTLKGWPALGDVYCNGERCRSCQALAPAGQCGSPGPLVNPTLASSGPEVGRPGHLAGSAREARDSTGRPKGESQRDNHPPLDSSLTPTYLRVKSWISNIFTEHNENINFNWFVSNQSEVLFKLFEYRNNNNNGIETLRKRY
jgi:hypothetical protein